MNNFIEEKAKVIYKTFSGKNKKVALDELYIANKCGVDNQDKLIRYHNLRQIVPVLIRRIAGKNDEDLFISFAKTQLDNDKISIIDIQNKFSSFMNSGNLIKKAYPNNFYFKEPFPRYDTTKWVAALNDLQIRARVYGNFKMAFDYVVGSWEDSDEKMDFARWLKFYADGGATLYKKAQIMNIPMQAIPGLNAGPGRASHNDAVMSTSIKQKPKLTIDDIRKKILARIFSIEKILSTPEGREYADKSMEKLFDALLVLKKYILQTKNASMFDELVKRETGRLVKNGCNSTLINLFEKIAQLPELPDMGGMDAAPPAGGDPNAAPAPAGGGSPEQGKKAISEFKENVIGKEAVEEAGKKIIEQFKKDVVDNKLKTKASWYNIKTPELVKFEKVANSIMSLVGNTKNHIRVVAQMANPPLQTQPVAAPEAMPVDESAMPIEGDALPTGNDENAPPTPDLSKERQQANDKELAKKNLTPQKTPDNASLLGIDSDVIDKALESITMNDVIARLQALSKVFQNREIARQLSVVDLMLDKLGISGFFPALAEATRSALESNQYCQSRVEEVLNKLISTTDDNGVSTVTPSKKNDNLVNKEIDEYLNGEKPKEVNQEESAAPEMAPEAPENLEQPQPMNEEIPVA